MNKMIEQTQYNPQEWQEKVNQFNQILAQAEALEKEDQGDPFTTKNLAEAFNLYQQCNYLIPNTKILTAAQRCQKKISWRHQFQSLFNEGNNYLKQGFFKQALAKFSQAKQIFCTAAVQTAIKNCEANLAQEKEYEKNLTQVYQLTEKGEFQKAFLLLKSMLEKFPRLDGQNFLLKLQEIITAKAYFMAGLLAEKEGKLLIAKDKYQRAIQLIPEREIYLIRLAIILIKLKKFDEALNLLVEIKNQQSYYLQGLIYAKQKQWKKVYQYWQYVTNSSLKKQQEIIKNLVIRDRLKKIKIIEEFVNLKQLEESQLATQVFIEKFGHDPIIKKNLDHHIIPTLQHQQWLEFELKLDQLNKIFEKQWIEQPNLIILHNLMIVTYYLFQNDPNYLQNLIPLWCNCLANLEKNPILNKVVWLNCTAINQQELAQNLQILLEEYLEKEKETNLEKYLKLRDSYRREKWALNLSKNQDNQGMIIHQIFITPGCYEKYYQNLQKFQLPQTILGTLYTYWGDTVAACLEKDFIRAMEIKPNSITSEIEKFAQTFVYYQISCFYLENYQWQEAIIYLTDLENELAELTEYQTNIDELCQKQRHQIEYFNEHLEFSQFWFNLIKSSNSLNYYIEYQAQKIILELEQEKISYNQAIFALKKLQKLGYDHPIVIDLLEKLEVEKELNLINNLLSEKEFETGIERAKQSKYDKVKMIVSQLCIHILIEGFKNHDLNFNDIYKLGKWAYELYPNDPAVQEIYDLTQELYQIQNLMLKDQFDEAVNLAKNSDYDLVRQYVTEFFIKTLLEGIDSGEIPLSMAKQLALWAYILSPDNPSYQTIYQSLDLIN